MKKTIHRSNTRGYADHGWLKSHHTFSFANYYNPERVRFGVLRVLNDDIVEGGMGFGTHPHDNMEIITIPLHGELAHKDSTGTKGVIKLNDVQIMSAGSGLTHSEFNNSEKELVNLLQIWILPKEKDIKPRYDQKTYDPNDRKNSLKLVVSPEKDNGSLWINQNAYFSLGNIDPGQSLNYKVHSNGNGLYLFVMAGTVEFADELLKDRDAIGLEDIEHVEIKAAEVSEILIMEVPMN